MARLPAGPGRDSPWCGPAQPARAAAVPCPRGQGFEARLTVAGSALLPARRGEGHRAAPAIDAVERALRVYGAPVYVRHEIVHNKYVVESLKKKGAVFVEELSEVPDTGAPVIFSAHGVPKAVPREAAERNFFAIDATCPLVTKVHREAELHFRRGHKIILVGHEGHPEVVGTLGQLPQGAVLLVETVADVDLLADRSPELVHAPLAFVTQTTLSVDDTQSVVEALKRRFPDIVGPHKEDICYATTNRQEAVKQIADKVDALLVVGSANSSNSQRLKEVSERAGCRNSQLVNGASEIDWTHLNDIRTIGITAGASAPEVLVEEIIDAFAERYDIEVETVSTTTETMFFPLPRELRETTDRVA